MNQDPTLEYVLACAKAAADKRATDIVVLDVRRLASFTDYFLIASGSSDRRVQAIAEGVLEAMGKLGRKPLGAEGVRDGRWALLDFGDWVVHAFYEDVRRAFDLEGLWFDAERVELPEEVLEPGRPAAAARRAEARLGGSR